MAFEIGENSLWPLAIVKIDKIKRKLLNYKKV